VEDGKKFTGWLPPVWRAVKSLLEGFHPQTGEIIFLPSLAIELLLVSSKIIKHKKARFF
jgi:hypothetical protein